MDEQLGADAAAGISALDVDRAARYRRSGRSQACSERKLTESYPAQDATVCKMRRGMQRRAARNKDVPRLA
jgi:hypothetical protein